MDELAVYLGRTLIAGIGFLLHARIEFCREPGEARQGPQIGDLDLNARIRTVTIARSRTRALDAHGFAALAGGLGASQPADCFGQQVLETVKIDRLNVLAAGHDLSDGIERGIHVDRGAGCRARVSRAGSPRRLFRAFRFLAHAPELADRIADTRAIGI